MVFVCVCSKSFLGSFFSSRARSARVCILQEKIKKYTSFESRFLFQIVISVAQSSSQRNTRASRVNEFFTPSPLLLPHPPSSRAHKRVRFFCCQSFFPQRLNVVVLPDSLRCWKTPRVSLNMRKDHHEFTTRWSINFCCWQTTMSRAFGIIHMENIRTHFTKHFHCEILYRIRTNSRTSFFALVSHIFSILETFAAYLSPKNQFLRLLCVTHTILKFASLECNKILFLLQHNSWFLFNN